MEKNKKKKNAWREMIALLAVLMVIFLSLIPLSNFLANITNYYCPAKTCWMEIRFSALEQLFTHLMFCLGIMLYLFIIIVFIILAYILLLELIRVFKSDKE